MKRRLVKLVVFLLLGAIVNVVVAWGCVLLQREPETKDWQSFGLGDDRAWEVFINRAVGVERVSSFCGTYNVFRVSRKPEPSTIPSDPLPTLPNWTRLECKPPVEIDRLDAAGWPALALAARLELVDMTSGYRSRPSIGGIAVSIASMKPDYPFFSDSVTLPLRPVWPGFAINTVFYAVILWMLFAAPFALRRWRRIRRGLCPACAYPVGESDVCTECGAALTRTHRT